ncbi:hypothetical protein H2200_010409 [Cladophialophora chaetospira]|uniref:Uncharacterized protein n=1 Tax=Cladophialophora chaetospira TaxID=386627 RepID=A0AA38X1H9_9EURO|nr:hypothetical protein H2200_010409 [Cladophialophora chaetospira]
MASSSPETPCPSRGGRRDMQNDAGLTAEDRPIDSPSESTDRTEELVDASSPIVRSDAGLEGDESGSEDDSAETISSTSSSSSRRSHNDDSDNENSSPEPEDFEVDARDLPLITRMNRLPDALAGTPFGQDIRAAAATIRGQLLAPLNGVDYRFQRPPPAMHPEIVTQQLWALHIQPDANATITQIISANIKTIYEILARLNASHAQLRQQSFQLVHLSTLEDTPADWLRDAVAENMAATREHEAWMEIMGLELQMSNLALERMMIAHGVEAYERQVAAGEITERERNWLVGPLFPVYQVRRGVLLRLARQVYELSGSGEFAERHGNELWDVMLA